jgi:hypothetical protein
MREIRAGQSRPVLDERGTLTLAVPSRSRSQYILDAGKLYTAYPLLRMAGGHGARIRLKYAECLTRNGQKDDRNAVEGSELAGYYDTITAGNGHGFWSPLHWRTSRFIELTIETADEPLVIPLLRFTDCHYPLLPAQPFRASDAQLDKF